MSRADCWACKARCSGKILTSESEEEVCCKDNYGPGICPLIKKNKIYGHCGKVLRCKGIQLRELGSRVTAWRGGGTW